MRGARSIWRHQELHNGHGASPASTMDRVPSDRIVDFNVYSPDPSGDDYEGCLVRASRLFKVVHVDHGQWRTDPVDTGGLETDYVENVAHYATIVGFFWLLETRSHIVTKWVSCSELR